MTPAKVRLVMASTGKPDAEVADFCKGLGIFRQALYRHVSPNGEARPDGVRVLARKEGPADAASWTLRPLLTWR
jgi:hypothetical protein